MRFYFPSQAAIQSIVLDVLQEREERAERRGDGENEDEDEDEKDEDED